MVGFFILPAYHFPRNKLGYSFYILIFFMCAFHSLFERESYQTSRTMTIFVTNTACFLAEKNTYFRKMIIGYRPITCLSLSINVSFCFVLGKHVIVALPGGPNCRGLLCTCIRWRPRHQGSRQNVASSTHGAKPLQQNNF